MTVIPLLNWKSERRGSQNQEGEKMTKAGRQRTCSTYFLVELRRGGGSVHP